MATYADVSSESEHSEAEINSDESDFSTVEEENFQGVVPYRFEPPALPGRQNRAEKCSHTNKIKAYFHCFTYKKSVLGPVTIAFLGMSKNT